MARRRVARVALDRGVKRPRDFTATTVERWLTSQTDHSLSTGTRNGYRRACVTFIHWCVRARRLTHDSMLDFAAADLRHSAPSQVARVSIRPKLLDVASAAERLPDLPLVRFGERVAFVATL